MAHSMDEIFDYANTNFTKTVHRELYPAIDPTRPQLSQAGKTILITGGGDNLGLAIGHAFVKANAKTVIITGRRLDVLQQAKKELDEANTKTTVHARVLDVSNVGQINAFWDKMQELEIAIDIFVSNAARPPKPQPVLEDPDEIWKQIETNAKGPLYMLKRFTSQSGGGQKFVVNVSSAVMHGYSHPAVQARPGTVISKTSANVIFQQIALDYNPDQLQVVSYSPGLLSNQYTRSLGLPEEKFDSREMAAAFAVWAATKEAAFLHGRFVWASWDVEELVEFRETLEQDPYFLRSSILPLRLGFRE